MSFVYMWLHETLENKNAYLRVGHWVLNNLAINTSFALTIAARECILLYISRNIVEILRVGVISMQNIWTPDSE